MAERESVKIIWKRFKWVNAFSAKCTFGSKWNTPNCLFLSYYEFLLWYVGNNQPGDIKYHIKYEHDEIKYGMPGC